MTDKELMSASRINALACPRQFYYHYEMNLQALGDAPRLHAGTCIHAALDVWYNLGRNDDDALSRLDEVWGDYEPPPDSDVKYLKHRHVQLVLERYFNHRRDDHWEPVLITVGLQPVGSEVLMNVDNYRARLDLPIRDEDGNLYIVDHKSTTGNMGEYFFKQFHVANQLRGYKRVLDGITDKDVAGVIVNGIYMGKAPRQDKSAFQRKTFVFQQWSITEHVDNIANYRSEVAWRRENDCWPQQAGILCRGCNFKSLCMSRPELRPKVAARDYGVRDEQR